VGQSIHCGDKSSKDPITSVNPGEAYIKVTVILVLGTITFNYSIFSNVIRPVAWGRGASGKPSFSDNYFIFMQIFFNIGRK
jgi:hypothetical protein